MLLYGRSQQRMLLTTNLSECVVVCIRATSHSEPPLSLSANKLKYTSPSASYVQGIFCNKSILHQVRRLATDCIKKTTLPCHCSTCVQTASDCSIQYAMYAWLIRLVGIGFAQVGDGKLHGLLRCVRLWNKKEREPL